MDNWGELVGVSPSRAANRNLTGFHLSSDDNINGLKADKHE